LQSAASRFALQLRAEKGFEAMAEGVRYWLLKSEPDCFSIDHLAAAPKQTTGWSGVRNFQARNFLRDDMKPGDRVLYYHSGANPPAVVGLATIVKPGYPDHTAEDKSDDHYDPKHTKANPIWYMVDVRFDEKLPRELSISELRALPALKDMVLLEKGSRLSVQPVKKAEFDAIVKLAGQKVGSQKSEVRKRKS
jgi:predicted RNA-binding protein with PUA-like domain